MERLLVERYPIVDERVVSEKVGGRVDLTIIIVNWNTRDLLLQTVGSVYTSLRGQAHIEMIVVDNASSDASVRALAAAFPDVHIIVNSRNMGFGPANNQALRVAQGRYSLLLNSDTIVQPDSLERLIAFMDATPAAAMCGVQVLNPDGSFQGSWAHYLTLWREALILTGLGRRIVNPYYPSAAPTQSQHNRIVDTIQGAFMFARTEALQQIGWLDESFFMYGEENDLGLRLHKAGWQTYYVADVTVVHLGGQSSRQNKRQMAWQLQSSKVCLFRKHYGRVSAMLLKLLVSLATLIKLLLWYSRQQTTTTPFMWSDFRRFLQT